MAALGVLALGLVAGVGCALGAAGLVVARFDRLDGATRLVGLAPLAITMAAALARAVLHWLGPRSRAGRSDLRGRGPSRIVERDPRPSDPQTGPPLT